MESIRLMLQEFNVFTRAEKHFITEEVLSANTEFMNAKLNNTDGESAKKCLFRGIHSYVTPTGSMGGRAGSNSITWHKPRRLERRRENASP